MSECWYSLNNWTTNTTFNCSLDYLNLTEGLSELLLGANDTYRNVNDSESAEIWVDLTPPNVTFSCSASQVSEGGVITCTCSATDNISPAENISLAYAPHPSTSGIYTHIVNCTATDLAGNTAVKYAQYTVVSGSSQQNPGGGGGSGGGATPSEGTDKVTASLGEITAAATLK
ncbi:MAG: hypothetical protein ACP5E4_01465 [Candidatus Aenigmatarchaeota archaeon]